MLSRSISLGGKIQRRTGLTVTLQSVCVIIHLSYVVFYGKKCARAVQKRLNRSFFGFSGHATNEKKNCALEKATSTALLIKHVATLKY